MRIQKCSWQLSHEHSATSYQKLYVMQIFGLFPENWRIYPVQTQKRKGTPTFKCIDNVRMRWKETWEIVLAKEVGLKKRLTSPHSSFLFEKKTNYLFYLWPGEKLHRNPHTGLLVLGQSYVAEASCSQLKNNKNNNAWPHGSKPSLKMTFLSSISSNLWIIVQTQFGGMWINSIFALNQTSRYHLSYSTF